MRISDWSSDVCSSDLLLEHLTFRGSEHIPDGEAKRIWQRFGVTFGSDSNAQTTPTQTVYQLDLPSVTPANLDESMKLLAGMMREPRISDAAVDAERGVVLAELRESNGPQKRSEEHTSELQSLMRISYAVFCLKKKKK